MRISFDLKFDTDKTQIELEEELRYFLKQTADYLNGDIFMSSSLNDTTPGEGLIEIYTDRTMCTDMGHTRRALSDLADYIWKNFM